MKKILGILLVCVLAYAPVTVHAVADLSNPEAAYFETVVIKRYFSSLSDIEKEKIREIIELRKLKVIPELTASIWREYQAEIASIKNNPNNLRDYKKALKQNGHIGMLDRLIFKERAWLKFKWRSDEEKYKNYLKEKEASARKRCSTSEFKHTAKCKKFFEKQHRKMAGRCAREVNKYTPDCRKFRKEQAVAAEKKMENKCRQAVNLYTPECKSFNRKRTEKIDRECQSSQQKNSSRCKSYFKQKQARLEKNCKTQKYRKTRECRIFAREMFDKKIAQCQQSGSKHTPECIALLNQKRASERQKCFVIKYQDTPGCKDFFEEADKKTNLYCSGKKNRKKSTCKNFGTSKFLTSRERAALTGCSDKDYKNTVECKKFVEELKRKIGKS